MINVEEAETRIKELLPGLPPQQQKFIMARATSPDDRVAAKAIDKDNLRFLTRWREKPAFMEAYTLVTKILAPSNNAIMLANSDRDDIVQAQIQSLSRVLPKVVQAHLDIIFGGESASVRMKAIETLYGIVGLDNGALIRVSRRNKVLVQMLEMLAPQLKAIASDRGIEKSPVDEFIDAQYEEVEEEE